MMRFAKEGNSGYHGGERESFVLYDIAAARALYDWSLFREDLTSGC
jgi:hypothetical protein